MSLRPSCLVLGSADDPHVIAISEAIDDAGIASVVFDIEQDRRLSLKTGETGLGISILGRALETYDVVLNRMKWRADPHCANADDFSRYFSYCEWVYALRGLMFVAEASGIPVLNRPEAGLRGANKVFQLRLAQGCGLVIPDTYIGTEADVLGEATHDWSNAIGKVFETSFVPPLDGQEAKTIFTSRLSRSDLSFYAQQIADDPPLILQQEIAKSTEARMIVSDNDVVCYTIHSQEAARSQLDWRHREMSVRYELSKPPASTLEAARLLLKRLSLDYAVFDFAITPYGDWIFFECNPDGQWWLPRERAGGRPETVIANAVIAAVNGGRDSGWRQLSDPFTGPGE